MAIINKPGPANTISLIGQIPEPPKIPEKLVSRFPEMGDYQSGLNKWWQNFSDQLARDRANIQSQFQIDEGTVTTIQTTLQTIGSQIAALQAQGSAVTPDVINSLAAQFAALTALVQTHIATGVAHRTASQIVGVTDEQALESKTIGQAQARYGRFSPLVARMRVDPGQTVQIGAGDAMLAPSPLDVFGSLIIAGTLIAL